MKKIILIVILIIFSAAMLTAQSESNLNLKIADVMEDFSRAWLELHPDPVSKQGIGITGISEDSGKAKSAKIGALVKAYLEEAMGRSLIFVLTDRENLNTILEEMKFSASGMVSDGSSVEIGELTGVKALISGNVTEEGDNFRIQLKLTEVETGENLAVSAFMMPVKTLVDASVELEYEYVAANGIGLSVKPAAYIYGADLFNKAKPIYLDIAAKYRLSREFMISAGLLMNIATGSDLYRWDNSFDPTHTVVTTADAQPDIPTAYGDTDIGQITGDLSTAFAAHLDFQYTLNFSPFFNIGINTGVMGFPNPVMTVMYGSSGSLYYNGSGYVDGSPLEPPEVSQVDNMPMEYIFENMFGAKIEINPEFFITPRIALTGTVGYLYTLPSPLRQVNASEGQWAYYDMAVESGFSGTAVEKYYGFDPVNMPGGGKWQLDLSGFYAGAAVSIFF